MRSGVSVKWDGLDKIFVQVDQKLSDKKELLSDMGEILISGTQQRFQKEESPKGEPWKTSRRAEEEGGLTLSDTARLRGSVVKKVGNDYVQVGSGVEYARIHQEGGTIRPKNKKLLRFRTPGGKAVFAKSVKIPARPYLGLSDEDRENLREAATDFIMDAFRKG